MDAVTMRYTLYIKEDKDFSLKGIKIATVSLIVTASILSKPPIVFRIGRIDLTSFDKIPT